MPAGADGKPTGLAFVEFDTPELAAAALRASFLKLLQCVVWQHSVAMLVLQKDRAMMGPRYLEIFLSSVAERDRYQ